MNLAGVARARRNPQAGRATRTLGMAWVLALLASASTWFYMDYILRAQQIADAAMHQRPRGNLSDLYPRWLGARELLLHRRNPYSEEITREIQQGYYGRPLDPARAKDPKDRQGFVYPVYVVFLLAPTVGLPFKEVQTGFRWFLMALAIASVLLWLYVLRWRVSAGYTFALAVLTLGWLPMVQGIKLQQLSLLVAGLLAAACACLAGGWFFLAGGLLALATIKPQLTWPLLLWFLVWALSGWQARKRFVFGFAFGMALLLGAAELVLPGWLRMFITALGQYHSYTQNQSVLLWMFGSIAGRIFEVLCVLGCAALIRPLRLAPATGAEFGRAISLILALTVVIVPMFAPYNQILLLPAILTLIHAATSRFTILPALRLAGMIALLLLVWPWVATAALTIAYRWLTPNFRQHLWPMPFYSNFVLPIFVFGLAAFDCWINAASGLREAFAAE